MRRLGMLIGLLCAVFGGALQARDVLDELSEAVDQLEGSFWRGYFHAPGHTRRNQSAAATEKVSRLARAVQSERKKPNQPGIDNPTNAAMTLMMLLRSSSNTGASVSVPATKPMSWSAFMREFKQKHPVKKGEKLPEIKREDYEAWLEKISGENGAAFSKGFRPGKKFSKLQRARLLGVEQRYRDAVIALRLSIFDIRRNDPAFMPEPAEQKKK